MKKSSDLKQETIVYTKSLTLPEEISHVFSIREETPFIYPVVYRNVRRAIVHRFPYLIWYRIIDEQVIVLACFHARQNPEKSRSRLR